MSQKDFLYRLARLTDLSARRGVSTLAPCFGGVQVKDRTPPALGASNLAEKNSRQKGDDNE
jgi:hypothetical protein